MNGLHAITQWQWLWLLHQVLFRQITCFPCLACSNGAIPTVILIMGGNLIKGN